MREDLFVLSVMLSLILIPGCLNVPPETKTLDEKPFGDTEMILVQDIEIEFQNCQNMTYSLDRDKCTLTVFTKIENMANGTSTCAKFQTPRLGAVCYSMVALSKSDYSVCDEVSESFRDQCYYLVAANTSDVDGCIRILDTNGKDECILQVAKSTKDGTLCGDVIHPTVRDACYMVIATSTGDSLLCQKISDTSPSIAISKDECFMNAAKGNLSVCDNIGRSDLKGKCYGEAAAVSGNISICASDSIDQSSCYIKAASVLEDPSVCEKFVSRIGSELMRENCFDYSYYNIAVKNDNASLCNKINSSTLRQSCEHSFGIYGK